MQDGGWRDEQCSMRHMYLCQKDKQASTMPTTVPRVQGCPHGWQAYRWACFNFIDAKRTWTDSAQLCNTLRGTMLHVEDRLDIFAVDVHTTSLIRNKHTEANS